MREEDHRFDTAGIDYGRHSVLRERRNPRKASPHERRVPRWVYRVILILVFSALAVLVWYNRVNFRPENVMEWMQSRIVGMGVGDGFPRTFTGSSVAPGNFISCDKNVIIASNTNVAVYNTTAKELLDTQHSYSEPVLKVSGSRALLYSMGGKECRVVSVGGQDKKITVQKEILAGALSSNGRFALVTEADGYNGKLTVYTADGKVQSYYWFSDYYPSAVALNSDGTEAAVAGVSAKNGKMTSVVYLLNLNSGKISSPFATYSETLFYALYWDSGSTVAAVGDTEVSVINAASRSKKDVDYAGLQLSAYCSNDGRTAVGLASYDGTSGYRLAVYDKNGAQVLEHRFDNSIQSVSLFGSTAAALSNGKVFFFSLSAASDSGASRDAGEDARAVALQDENSAYILGVSEIRLVKNG